MLRFIERESNYIPSSIYIVRCILWHAEHGKQGPNPLVVPWTPYVPSPYRKRAKSITVAALLSLIVGIIGLVVGSAMIVLDLAGSHAFGSQMPADFQPVLDLGATLGFGTALVIFVGSVMHLFGWYWLWKRSKIGGVLGIINGANDIIFPAGGGLWLTFSVLPSLGMNIYEMPWLIQTLSAIGIVGIVILAMLALGWKTLKES
jgi:hypothetical protein